MTRLILFATFMLTGSVLGVPARADEPSKKLTEEERKVLESKGLELNEVGLKAARAGKYLEAQKAWEAALEVARQLYPKDQFPDGHANLATSLSNLGALLKAQGKLAEAEPRLRDALEMTKRVFTGDQPEVARSLDNLASLLYAEGKLTEAEPLFRNALEVRKRLFKGDHSDLATSLNNLAFLYQAQAKLTEAESLFRDSLAMHERLFKGDHPTVAISLNNLAILHQAQGKLAEAETLCRTSLDMRKRLFQGDHPDVAHSMSTLAYLYQAQGKVTEAEPLDRAALDMRKRLFKGDHPDLAGSLNNLAAVLLQQGKLAEAEPLFRNALEMRKRLFQGDHPGVVSTLSNLAGLLRSQGKLVEAESHYRAALDMTKRISEGDHPETAGILNNFAFLYQAQGKLAEAETLFSDSLAMSRRLVQTFANEKSEGEALTYISSLPLHRDCFLSLALMRKTPPATVYRQLWSSKGDIARIYERRALAARVAAVNPQAAEILAELAETRRRRAELILAPTTTDPITRNKREEGIQDYDEKIKKLDKALRPLFPTLERVEELARATPDDLRNFLPPHAVFVDFIAFTLFDRDQKRPDLQGRVLPFCYAAFVVSREGVTWIDLESAKPIDEALLKWRNAITSGKESPPEIPKKLRELVWAKIRKAFPSDTKIVYLSPDWALTQVPWSALPGDKPGTIVLEEFAFATIPHGPFLLDKLTPQNQGKKTASSALIVGGVKYDAELSSLALNTLPSRGQPLIKAGARLAWPFLPGTAAEADGVSNLAVPRKLVVTALKADQATSLAVLTALPKANYAHFATHGFFADPLFRSVFQLDEKDFKKTWRGERIGHAANSPLVMTGLVFAGANNPKTPAKGILTGEALIDLDLSGLELAVLSACETGLGDVADGEGTFGLQRAFHMAGTRDVIASLWKVPDQSTAALMALFYRNLWIQNLSPMESLRQAQLEIYKNPTKIPELAKGFRGRFDEVPGSGGEAEIKPNKDGKAHPLLWAAFTLSGPGQ